MTNNRALLCMLLTVILPHGSPRASSPFDRNFRELRTIVAVSARTNNRIGISYSLPVKYDFFHPGIGCAYGLRRSPRTSYSPDWIVDGGDTNYIVTKEEYGKRTEHRLYLDCGPTIFLKRIHMGFTVGNRLAFIRYDRTVEHLGVRTDSVVSTSEDRDQLRIDNHSMVSAFVGYHYKRFGIQGYVLSFPDGSGSIDAGVSVGWALLKRESKRVGRSNCVDYADRVDWRRRWKERRERR